MYFVRQREVEKLSHRHILPTISLDQRGHHVFLQLVIQNAFRRQCRLDPIVNFRRMIHAGSHRLKEKTS
jgi:hypothetical protein